VKSRSIRALSVAAAAAMSFALLPGPAAHAAFPGANGRIAFESGRTDELDIYSAKPDGSDLRRLTGGGTAVDQHPRWSPDGSRILWTRAASFDSAGNVWVMDADGSNKTRLTSSPANEADAAWSPDGERIVFWRSSQSHAADLWIMDADGTNQHRLTFSPAADIAPSWSSTDVIAFTSFRTGNGDVYTINPNGSGLHQVTHQTPPDLSPDWAPDGSKIAFFTEGGGLTNKREVWKVWADGTHLKRLTNNNVDDSYPSWSPAGGRITLQRDVREGDLDFYDVWTMKANGTDFQRVTHDAFTDGVPNWQAK
jgi:Tol biopolymer transport system component